MIERLRRWHRARGGLALDLALYLVGTAFAALTSVTSTLPAHREWGVIALGGYAFAASLSLSQLLAPRPPADLEVLAGSGGSETTKTPRSAGAATAAGRAVVVVIAWLGATVAPLVVQAVQRAYGQPFRAQEEVPVIEDGAARLIDTGTPYLTRDQVSLLAEPLLGYLPYQPGMTVFGLPRALLGVHWYTDARVWFALATAAALLAALHQLKAAGVADTLLIRGAQVAVLPICALTLATGGDDLPVLALCLLALSFAARGRWWAVGFAVGTAAALKLFAWPIVAVLIIYAATRGARAAARTALPAIGVPVATLIPAIVMAPGAVAENLFWYPIGQGLVASPAASPLPGQLIATLVPGGKWIALSLLLAAGVGIGLWLLRRPPRDAGQVAAVCAVGMLTAILLLPATRFGYLLYPAAYGIWIVLLTAGTVRIPVPSKSP
ncbi:MAG: glycosyltransferase 87 family protein [Micromonosporaceae bacterium]